MNRSRFVSVDGDELAERDEPPGAAVDGGLEEAVDARALGAVEAEDDRHRVARASRRAGGPTSAPFSATRRVRATTSGVTPARAAFSRSTTSSDLRRLVLDEPVDVDDAGGLLEDLPHLAREADPLLHVGAVDLGDHRREDGRPGRHLGHLDVRAVALARSAARSVRTSLANVWLSRLRWSFGRRLTWRSATRGPERRK